MTLTWGNNLINNPNKGINGPYVDGISITLGMPRKHVWIFASGHEDVTIQSYVFLSMCRYSWKCCSFVCRWPLLLCCESGAAEIARSVWYTTDPLWDGKGCIDSNNNCCTNVGMPWFHMPYTLTSIPSMTPKILQRNASNSNVYKHALRILIIITFNYDFHLTSVYTEFINNSHAY